MLSDFSKLIIVRILRPETLIQGITEYVKKHLSEEMVDSSNFNLEIAFNNSSCYIPIIFILSKGCDPTSTFSQFHSDYNKCSEVKLEILSLGQGQGEKAKQLILEGRSNGNWILLQNCHLATSCLELLERLQDT
jgi:dynein heavy chain